MKKRIEPTLVEKATHAVPGFDLVLKKLSQQVTLLGLPVWILPFVLFANLENFTELLNCLK